MDSGRRLPSQRRLTRLVVAGAAVMLVVAVVVAASRGGTPPPLPLPGTGTVPRQGDPFAYTASREAQFVARATAGSAHVLFTKSPGGVLATAARVARLRGLVDAATASTGVDPNILEALVFLESAGRPDAIAGVDPVAAAGLTQILAQTGQSLLGMHIDLASSRRLTAAIDRASFLGQTATVARLERRRARIDDRFDAARALAGAVRYLKIARRDLGRADLAVVSYHMGIGNLQQVLADYGGGSSVPYVQLFFDPAPDHHGAAYRLLSGFGDDSSLYYWRLLGAEEVMRLFRGDRAALGRLSSLQTASGSAALVLHPPDRTPGFSSPEKLDYAYASRTVIPLPANATALGLAYDPSIGSLARQLGVKPALYRGLRPAALDLLIELAARVRTLSGGASPLIVSSAVTDRRYQRQLGVGDPPAAAGWSFTIARRYVSRRQAEAFQAMLDRLQALNVIAWQRYPSEIEVTVASDASRVIAGGV
jgi:transglycosylase-like protein with SLT domain